MASTFRMSGLERTGRTAFQDAGPLLDIHRNHPGTEEAWTAIVLAGQRPGPDPVALAFGEHYKALVPVCGAPMLERVLRTLLDTPAIARIVVLAQRPEALLQGSLAWAADHDRIDLAESIGGIAESISAVAGSLLAPWPLLITTADHPLLSRAMVEAFLECATATDVSVAAVERQTVLSRYPQSKRTWLKFRDGAYSGANLFALRNAGTREALDLWTRAERDRKQAFRLFWHFGPLLALRAITRTIGFDNALKRAGANLGVSAALVSLDFAEAAIDVDKLEDHRLVETILARR